MQPWLRITGIEKEEHIHTDDLGSLCILLDQSVEFQTLEVEESPASLNSML